MSPSAWITGAASTAFGRLPGSQPLELMHEAVTLACERAALPLERVDTVLCGYATTLPHLMLASLLSERLAITPDWASGLQMGGATGAAMVMLARELILSGRSRQVLVVAGENRLSGQSRDQSIQTLAQVGDADFEVPHGTSVPAYYALLASRYLATTGMNEGDLAELAVLMRRHASTHRLAHHRAPLAVGDVLASRPVASPLKLLDCCPVSDGAAALIVSASASTRTPRAVRVAGAAQAHQHQHLSALQDITSTGARRSTLAALNQACRSHDDVDYLAIYDSFTITLAMLLEETGFIPRGDSGRAAREGRLGWDGPLPLNTHGGLLSFGHSGVAGGLAHVVECWEQLAGVAGPRQAGNRRCAFVHADGGVLSAHVSLVLEALDAP